MNRRERRALERKMGITSHKKSLPLSEQFEIIRNNIIAAKQDKEERTRQSKDKKQEHIAEKANQSIYDLALTISMEENIPFMDAIDLAKQRINTK
jgi:hypothetical protein